MVCKHCSSTSIKVVGGRKLCANCGRPITPVKGTLAARAPRTTADIHPVRRSQPLARRPAPQPRIADVGTPATPAVATVVAKQPRPKTKPQKVSAERRPKGNQFAMLKASVLGGTLAALVAVLMFLAIHISKTTSLGTFFHFLATRSTHTKELVVALAPAMVLFFALIKLIWLSWEAAAVYATSRLYDHRPASRKQVRAAGSNAMGSLTALLVVSAATAAIWLGATTLVIKGVSALGLVYWQIAALGVAASFIMVLVGLWLAAGLGLAGFVIVLAGESYFQAIRSGFRLASRRYALAAGTALWLAVCTAATICASAAGFIVLSLGRFSFPIWLQAVLGAVITLMVFSGFNWYSVGHWLMRFRQSVHQIETEDSQIHLLSGRKPKKINYPGIAVSLVWWLVVVVIGGWLIWHFKVNPTNLLNRLSAAIY